VHARRGAFPSHSTTYPVTSRAPQASICVGNVTTRVTIPTSMIRDRPEDSLGPIPSSRWSEGLRLRLTGRSPRCAATKNVGVIALGPILSPRQACAYHSEPSARVHVALRRLDPCAASKNADDLSGILLARSDGVHPRTALAIEERAIGSQATGFLKVSVKVALDLVEGA
jgi:hypothetical protein